MQDIYFAGNIVKDKLYLNKGNLVFDDITDKAGIIHDGGWSSGVTIADVNDDGFADIFISRELYDDKPDLRNPLIIQDLTGQITENQTELLKTVKIVEALQISLEQKRKEMDEKNNGA